MANNKALGKAKQAKNDEFYTLLQDIENELRHYTEHFKDKVVLCNCDDPFESNFFKYFALNFNRLGLRKLICTCFSRSLMFRHDAYVAVVDRLYDANGDGAEDLADVEIIMRENGYPHRLNGDGDFRSEECLEYLREADIVVTNPPFSLFREFVATLLAFDKKFLIIGNQNAIKYKEIFPLIKDNVIWIGVNSGSMKFIIPRVYDEDKTNIGRDDDGNLTSSMGNICWYTNLDHYKRHRPLDLFKKYTPEEYPTYANFDAINVDSVNNIPADYDGYMGVPTFFMTLYCPDQFEVLGTAEGDSGRALGLKRCPKELKMINPSLRDGQLYYLRDDKPVKPYNRIIIRKKKS